MKNTTDDHPWPEVGLSVVPAFVGFDVHEKGILFVDRQT